MLTCSSQVFTRRSKQSPHQAEFMAPLFDKLESAQFIHQLKPLQDAFGYINDVRMTPRLIEIPRERPAGSDAARAAWSPSWVVAIAT